MRSKCKSAKRQAEELRRLIWSKTDEQWLAEMCPEARARCKEIDALAKRIGSAPWFNVVEEMRKIREGQE